MNYTVEIDPPALRELQKLPRPMFGAAIRAIIRLVGDPRPPGAGNLAGMPGCMKLRIGDYRVLYAVDDKARTVAVFRVGHRGSVYERP